MEKPEVTADAVLGQIKQLWIENGQSLTKKDVKKQHPDVMRTALYYYPSWEHALSNALEEPQ